MRDTARAIGPTVPQSSLPHCTKGLNLGPRSLAESHFLHFPISTNPATQSIVPMLSRFQNCRVGQNHSFIATNKRMDLRLLYLKPSLVLVLISEKKKTNTKYERCRAEFLRQPKQQVAPSQRVTLVEQNSQQHLVISLNIFEY